MANGTTESRNGDHHWRDDGHYWYRPSDESTVEVLEAVRRHREAEVAMRRRMRDDMEMGDTDLAALRWIIREERAGRPVTSAGLARTLGITTAATVKVVKRLSQGAYIERTAHPSDRRVQLLGTLPGAHVRVREALGSMHERMLQLASSLDADERAVVVRFFDGLVDALESAPDHPHDGSS
jgi:DNA-binding MarR family transcriptional regulator